MSDILLDYPQTNRVNSNRYLELLVRPRRGFQKLLSAGRSTWQLPMLLLSIGVLLHTIVSGYLRTRAAAQGALVLPPDWEWWSPIMQNNYMQGIQTTQGAAYIYVIPVVTSLIGLWLGWPILSSMLHLTSTLLGGRGTQVSTLNMVAWAKLPQAIRNLLRALYMLAANQTIISPGLSGFVNSASGSSIFLGNLLKQTDLFLAWQILLLAIGLTQLNGLSKLKTWLAVMLVMLIIVLSLAGLSSLFASFTGTVISRPF